MTQPKTESTAMSGETLFPVDRVKITSFPHIVALGQFVALMDMVEALAKTPEKQRAPGYALALAMVETAAAKAKADILHRNLRAAAKAGINVGSAGRIGLEGDEIVASHYSDEDDQ